MITEASEEKQRQYELSRKKVREQFYKARGEDIPPEYLSRADVLSEESEY